MRRAEGPPQRARERALLTPREPAGLRHGKAAGLHRPSRQRRRTLAIQTTSARRRRAPWGAPAQRRPAIASMNPSSRRAVVADRSARANPGADLGDTQPKPASPPPTPGPLRRREAEGTAGTRSSARKGPRPSRSRRHARLPPRGTTTGAGRPDPRRACGHPRTLAIPGALRRAEPRRRSGTAHRDA